MSVSAVAAAGTALAIYYVRRRGVCSEDPSPAETHSTVHSAPTTFMEDLFFLAEGLRYTYGETLGRWRTADLLIGLAYLCRKDPEEHPVSDIAQQGRPFGRGLAPELWPEALVQLGELERFFRYCSGLRERRPLPQRHYFRTVLDVTDEDLLMQELRAGVLKPSYLLVRDRKLQAVVLAIRGTHSFKDMFTSLTGASKPHHLVDANGVVLGYSHFGMLAAARWIKAQTRQRLEQALADNPGYRLKIIGHSLGGGTAALLTMMLREEGGIFAQSTCVAIACPSCMTLELAQSCSDYVTTVVHNADVIPTICPGSADTLRAEVMRSSWFGEFRRDVRSSGVVRAVENGLRGVGSATLTATSWTTSKLAACYQRGSFGGGVRRRQLLKRRNSDDSLAATAAAEEAAAAAAAAAVPGGGEAAALLGGSPLSASAPAGSGFGAFAAALEEEQQQAAAAGGIPATADSTAERLGSGGGWGLRVSQQLSGRGAAVLSGTSQMLQSTSGVLRSTSGLLMRRMWPAGGGEAAGAGNGGALAAAAAEEAVAGAAAADAAPDRMEIEAADEEELAAYADGFPLDGGDGDEDMGGEEGWEEDEAAAEQPGGGGAGSSERVSISYQERRQMRVQLQLERSGSLEEEVSLRMHEVQQAVHDAEEEEQASGRDDSTVPAVIRPGGYGIGGGPSAAPLSPSKLDPKWKRQMYPAGRILHLVPARLVPGTAAYAAAAAAAAAAAQAAKAASAVDASDCERGDLGLAVTGAAPEAAAASAGDAEAAAAGPAAAAAGGSAAAVPGGTAASGTATGPTVRPRHAAKLSVSDLIGGEEMLGRRSCAGWEDAPAGDLGGNGGNGDEAEQAQQAQQQAQQQAVQEEMLLLDYVPQEAYARIRLCRTVLSDHIIPNYLKSLESALQHIKEHAELVPIPVPVPAPAPTGTAAADKGAASAPASLAVAAAAAAPSAAAAPAAGEAVGARGGSHAAAAGPMSPSAGSSSPAAAAAAAALRSAAAKASFSKSSKHD